MDWFHRIQLPSGEYTPGVVMHGPDGGNWPTTRFGLPEDLTGKSVVDIGCFDGFFSFECEKRGAEYVLAKDRSKSEGFEFAHRELNSKVHWSKFDIEVDISVAGGTMDLVLFYGVLYHLKNPLRAMERLPMFLKPGGVCLLETAISKFNEFPMLEYRPNEEGDPSNFFYANHKWIETASKEVGFKSCEKIFELENGSRATYRLTK